MLGTYRGHAIISDDGQKWRYADTGDIVSKDRPCGNCERTQTKEGHDGCLGKLPYVMNACCGHGTIRDAYVQFPSGIIMRGISAVVVQKILKKRGQNEVPRILPGASRAP